MSGSQIFVGIGLIFGFGRAWSCSSARSSHWSPLSEPTSRGTSGSLVGSMDPRGIVAASTAATFSAPLIALGIGGANKLLPATFLVIVGTVTIYGLGAAPLVRALGLGGGEPETTPALEPPSVTTESDTPSKPQRRQGTID